MMRLVVMRLAPPAAQAGRPRPGQASPQARGLVLQQSANNPRVKRWERKGEAEADPRREPKPPSSDVNYRHPDTGETRTGKVRSGGPQGITVVDHETGQAHKVAHGHYVVPEAPQGDKAEAVAEKGQARAGEAKGPAEGGDAAVDWRKEHPGLSRYPTKGVKRGDVEVGGPEHNWRLRWRHPDTGAVQQAYEPAYLKENARKKFAKMQKFGAALPAFRAAVRLDVEHSPEMEIAVLGAMALVTDATMMRPGGSSEETTGLTTLKHQHVSVAGDEVVFDYIGKAGIPNRQTLRDPQVATVVKHLLEHAPEAGGLWQAVDERGRWKPVTLGRFSAYIDEHTKGGNAKDFRTWHATRIFAQEADRIGPPRTDAEAEEKIQEAALAVAKALGHKKGSTHAHFIKVSPRATTAHGLAEKHGGEHYGGGVVGFHSAGDRKAYTKALGKTGHEVMSKDQAPRGAERHTHYKPETSTSLDNYIDPTVVEAYRHGLTLSGGTLRKGTEGLTPDERRFQGFLARVGKADVWGTEWSPDDDEAHHGEK